MIMDTFSYQSSTPVIVFDLLLVFISDLRGILWLNSAPRVRALWLTVCTL